MAEYQKILPDVMSTDPEQTISDIRMFLCVYAAISRRAARIVVMCPYI
jgi:predicted methyltransferase